jgi:hypothetical protein
VGHYSSEGHTVYLNSWDITRVQYNDERKRDCQEKMRSQTEYISQKGHFDTNVVSRPGTLFHDRPHLS